MDFLVIEKDAPLYVFGEVDENTEPETPMWDCDVCSRRQATRQYPGAYGKVTLCNDCLGYGGVK